MTLGNRLSIGRGFGPFSVNYTKDRLPRRNRRENVTVTCRSEIAKYFLDVPRDNTHFLAGMGIARVMHAVAP
jgi:hypothetical protein